MPPRFLSTDQIDHFIQKGYVTVPGCFSREEARARTDKAFVRLGYDRNDPATWLKPRINMPGGETVDFETYAPKAFAAAVDLVGGVDRICRPMPMSPDAQIPNFTEGADRPWELPSAKSPGWHKDGDFFLHFLDSPEQGLLMIFLYSDIAPHGGGTFGAVDSIGVIARFLAAHPEGVEPGGFDCKTRLAECREYIEWTGNAGDVILMHPYMVHASSQNHSGIPRFIINPPLYLNEPMNFNRANPDDFSPVERAVLRGLGVERYDFKPASPRRAIVPQRVLDQRKMEEEEKRRLVAVEAK